MHSYTNIRNNSPQGQRTKTLKRSLDGHKHISNNKIVTW